MVLYKSQLSPFCHPAQSSRISDFTLHFSRHLRIPSTCNTPTPFSALFRAHISPDCAALLYTHLVESTCLHNTIATSIDQHLCRHPRQLLDRIPGHGSGCVLPAHGSQVWYSSSAIVTLQLCKATFREGRNHDSVLHGRQTLRFPLWVSQLPLVLAAYRLTKPESALSQYPLSHHQHRDPFHICRPRPDAHCNP